MSFLDLWVVGLGWKEGVPAGITPNPHLANFPFKLIHVDFSDSRYFRIVTQIGQNPLGGSLVLPDAGQHP